MTDQNDDKHWQESVAYYPPGYKAKKWAPQTLQRYEVRGLAMGHAFLRTNKAINQVADELFLANALVEGPMMNFGLNIDLSKAESGYVYDPRYKELAIHCAPGMGYRANREEMWRALGCGYGMMFDFKTGTYADGVYRRKAQRKPTASERISVWNGAGKAHYGKDDGKLAGKVRADASNHARKVMAMQRALSSPENAEFVKLYRSYGGFYSGKVFED